MKEGYTKLHIKSIYKNKDGRWRAYYVDDNGDKHVCSYPRILMEQKLGRPLKPNEDVHHKDENPDNNELNNLEIYMHGEHQRMHSAKFKDTAEICIICGNQFIMPAAKWSRFYSEMKRGINRYLTCCKSCAGKVSSHTHLYDINERLKEVDPFL